MPKTKVTFDIDAIRVVHVSAKDQGTHKEQQIVLQSSGGLSKEKIEQMVHEAEQFAESDKQKKDLIEVVNTAESAIYDTQQNMDEYKSQLPPEEIKNKISELSNVIANKDEPAETVREATNNLALHCLNLLTRTEDHRVKDHQVKDHQVTDHYHNLQARHHQLSIPVTHCVILWRSRIDC